MTQQQVPRPDLPYPGYRPKRNRSVLFWLAPAPVIAALITWYWHTPQDQPVSVAKTHTVVYQADGSGARGVRSANYTLQSDDGGTRQGEINLPMTTKSGATGLTFTGFKSGDFVYLSIQNADAAGSVTCRIVVDGVTISENTSDGGYAIASCKGQVP